MPDSNHRVDALSCIHRAGTTGSAHSLLDGSGLTFIDAGAPPSGTSTGKVHFVGVDFIAIGSFVFKDEAIAH